MSRFVHILGSGLLAQELQHVCRASDIRCQIWPKTQVDITSVSTFEAMSLHHDALHRHVLIVNTAAFTDVDGAEGNPGLTMAVNAAGAGNVARYAASRQIPLVHISSDAVFDAEGLAPTELDIPSTTPASVYAQSKLLGERWVMAQHPQATIVRTGNLYGEHGRGWPSKISIALRDGTADQSVIADDYRDVAPTWARWVAEVCLMKLPSGPVHACAAGQTTWYGYTKRMAERQQSKILLRGDRFERRAMLPRRGTLSSVVLPIGGVEPPSWEDLMDRFLSEEKTCSVS